MTGDVEYRAGEPGMLIPVPGEPWQLDLGFKHPDTKLYRLVIFQSWQYLVKNLIRKIKEPERSFFINQHIAVQVNY